MDKNVPNQILLDLEDKHLTKYNWKLKKSGDTIQARVNGRVVTLGQAILDPPTGFDVDHINRNIWDNRRSNLRIVTHAANLLNNKGTNIYLSANMVDPTYFVQIKQDGTLYRKTGIKTIEEAQFIRDEMKSLLLRKALEKTRDLNPHLSDAQFYC